MNAREAEVPLEIGVEERRDEPARRAVDVQRDVEPGARLEVVERAASSFTGSYTPLYVTPRIGTTPIVFSSTAASMPSGVRYGLSFVIGT